LLDLEHQLGFPPDVVGTVEDPCTDRFVLRGVDPRCDAGVPLDEHLVAPLDQLVHPHRSDPHSELAVLDLAGYSDLHRSLVPSVRPAEAQHCRWWRAAVTHSRCESSHAQGLAMVDYSVWCNPV